MGLKILIVGAGVGGPALASLLVRARQGHSITVIERSHELRTGGAQIDVKCQAVPILDKMDLLGQLKKYAVHETGLEIVNSQDQSLMKLGVSAADKRGFTLTSEYEIMRGDLVRILYADSIERANRGLAHDQACGDLSYRFDSTVARLYQHSRGVQVTFSDGMEQDFDLVVAADGQGSRTRRLAFGSAVSAAAFKELGIHVAYFTIPRATFEGGLARLCMEPGKLLLTRTSNRPVTSLNIFTMTHGETIKESYSESTASQKARWEQVLDKSSWQSERFKEGLRECEDFYAHEQGQVKMPKLSTGRVVLLGDAGYCPSPFTGLGTTLALGGAYTLAGELAKHVDNVDQALLEYESALRPLIDECQQLSPGGPQAFFPNSAMKVRIVEAVVWAMSSLRIDRLLNTWMSSHTSDEAGWKPRVYPELDLEHA